MPEPVITFDTRYLLLSNGCNMAYIDEGSGSQTLLFIHGLGNYSRSWTRNIQYLQQSYRCIAIDLPGNGYSSRNGYPYSMDFFAACIYDFIVKMGLKNLCVVGHSMGGQIAATLLIKAPEAAERLILCAPAGLERFNSYEKTFYRNALNFMDMISTEENSLRKSIQSSFFLNTHQADGLIEELIVQMRSYPIAQYRAMIDKCILGMLNEPVFDRLKEIRQPALVIFGERDALIPNRLLHPVTTRQIGLDGVGQLPHARLEMIPQCGHFLQWEKADTVNHLIRQFIQEQIRP